MGSIGLLCMWRHQKTARRANKPVRGPLEDSETANCDIDTYCSPRFYPRNRRTPTENWGRILERRPGMIKNRVLLSAVIAAGMAAAVFAADVTGTWTATFDTQVGAQKYTYT